jgi:hypothetical protein
MSSSPIPIRRRIVELASRSRRNAARFTHTIYQSDLEKLIGKRIRVSEQKKELEEMEREIEIALKSGAVIEDGIHTARRRPMKRGGYKVGACSYFVLEVK